MGSRCWVGLRGGRMIDGDGVDGGGWVLGGGVVV